jgi:type IV pilus assembly protein PilC
MPRYQYQAIDPEGSPRTDTAEAANQRELAERLRSEGYQVNRIDRLDLPEGITRLKDRLSWEDLTLFNDHLRMAVEARMPLSPALEAFARDLRAGRLRSTVESLRVAVEGGESLDNALARMGDRFPRVYSAVIRAGERSGNLPAVLSMMTEYSRRAVDLRSHVRASLVYPAVVLVVALGILAGMLIYVVPVFGRVFQDFGARLPWPTRMWLALSKSVQMNWPMWITGICGSVILVTVLWKMARRTEGGRLFTDRIVFRIPVFGKIARTDALARFCHTLGLLLGGRVPVEDALLLSGAATGNMVLARAAEQALGHVRNGESLSESLSRTRRFGHMFCWLVGNAEREGGNMREALANLGASYERNAVHAGRTVKMLLAPVIVILLGFMIGTLIGSLYLPIFTLADSLAG